MQIHESAEDYLESVLILSKQLGNVRSIDIVNYFDYSKQHKRGYEESENERICYR